MPLTGKRHGGLKGDTYGEFNAAEKSTAALEIILEILSGQEWSSDTCEAIAVVMRAAGYEIKDVEYDGPEGEKHDENG